MRLKKGTLENYVNNLEIGDHVYINAINCTNGAIDLLRYYIKSGILIPSEEEAKRFYTNIEVVKTGDVIIPQLTYRKGE